MEELPFKPASPAASKPSTSSKAPSTSASTRRATGESKKSQDSKSRLSTASRKTQTSLDVIERDVERIKAKIKTGEDIDAQEVLQAVLLMLDDMRLTMTELKDEKKKNTPDVEVIVHPNEAPNDVGEKHSLLNVNVKNLRKNLSALQMYTQIQACPSFMVVTETSIQELDQAQLKGTLFRSSQKITRNNWHDFQDIILLSLRRVTPPSSRAVASASMSGPSTGCKSAIE